MSYNETIMGKIPGATEENYENLAHDIGCYGKVYNRPHPGHKSDVFPLQKVCLAEGLDSDV